MDLTGSAFLFTLAGLSVSFVGFSTLVIILRQTLGGRMSKLDILITKIFIQLGFIVAAGAMLPPLLSLFHLPEIVVWRMASIAAAILACLFAATYPMRRWTASASPTPPIVWIDVLILLSSGAVLALNGIGGFGEPGPAPFAAELTGVLFLSGWAYLQALNLLLIPHIDRLDRGPGP